jgi:hypothetical protein
VSLRREIEHVTIEGPQNAIAALDAVREDFMRAGRIRTLDLRSVPTASEEGVRIVQPVFVDE